jgi:hypothetical protein
MRIDVFSNFATQEEINLLNEWTELGVENKWLDAGIAKEFVSTKTRLTSRFYAHRFNYPQEILKLSEKIRCYVGVNNYPLIEGHGRDGVVVSYTYPGGDVYKHKDPKSFDGLATLRCNILTRKADVGGVLYVDGQQVDVEVGDLHCYLVSEHEHWATKVEGETPRIMWMFGAHVPADDWNSGKIKVQQ